MALALATTDHQCAGSCHAARSDLAANIAVITHPAASATPAGTATADDFQRINSDARHSLERMLGVEAAPAQQHQQHQQQPTAVDSPGLMTLDELEDKLSAHRPDLNTASLQIVLRLMARWGSACDTEEVGLLLLQGPAALLQSYQDSVDEGELSATTVDHYLKAALKVIRVQEVEQQLLQAVTVTTAAAAAAAATGGTQTAAGGAAESSSPADILRHCISSLQQAATEWLARSKQKQRSLNSIADNSSMQRGNRRRSRVIQQHEQQEEQKQEEESSESLEVTHSSSSRSVSLDDDDAPSNNGFSERATDAKVTVVMTVLMARVTYTAS